MKKIYGYIRVSTKDQNEDRQKDCFGAVSGTVRKHFYG